MPKREYEESANRAVAFKVLYENRGSVVSSAALTEELGISRQAVNKIISSLKEEGIPVVSIPQKGYMTGDVENCDSLSPALVEYFLAECPPFRRFIYADETDSTQKIIKKFAQAGEKEGLVAAAGLQTEGRGRRGRSWSAAKDRNLMFSMLLRPRLKPGEVQLLNLAAGMAVKAAVNDLTGLKCELKWPNDILCGGKKLCGILSEAAGEPDRIYYAVTGVGLNVNMTADDIPEELADRAASLRTETGRTWPRYKLLIGILARFSKLLAELDGKEGAARLVARYRDECDTIGRQIKVMQDDETIFGKATDITPEGALIAETEAGTKIFAAADVQHLRLA